MKQAYRNNLESFLRYAGMLLLITALNGCSLVDQTLDDFKKPTARVNSVSVTDMTLESVTLLFDLSVKNPNRIAIESDGLDYRLSVSQLPLVSVERSREKVNLPARGRGSLAVPVTVNFADLYQVASSLKTRNEVDYAMELGIFFDLPLIGQFRVPISHADSLPVPRLPGIGLAAVKLEKFSLSGASIILDLDITNGNSFAIDLDQLEYQISANGSSLGGGKVDSIAMPENNLTRLSMPLDIRFDRLGATIYQLLAGGEPVNIGFSGGVDLLPAIGAWKPDRMNFDLNRQLTK